MRYFKSQYYDQFLYYSEAYSILNNERFNCKNLVYFQTSILFTKKGRVLLCLEEIRVSYALVKYIQLKISVYRQIN